MTPLRSVMGLAAVVAAIFALACQTAAPAPPTPAAPAPGAPPAAAKPTPPAKPAVAQNIAYATATVPPDLNPWNFVGAIAHINRSIFDRLVNLNQYRAEPMIATAWRQTDPTTWEFTLRQNVKFHDGSTMTAEDVKFSLDVARDPNIGMAGVAANLATIDQVTIANPTTIRITTKQPDVTLLTTLHLGSIISKRAHDTLGVQGFRERPVATGPFKVKTIEPTQNSVTIEAFADHWGGRPRLNEVRFRQIPEAAVRVQALRTREVDLIHDVPADLAAQVRQGGAQTPTQLFPTMISLIYNTSHPEIRDRRVRLAMNYAVDRDQIVRDLTLNLTKPAQGQPLTDAIIGFNPRIQAYPYDPARARQLLAEAGWSAGTTLNMPYGTFLAIYRPLAENLAFQLQQVGIRTNLQGLELAAFIGDFAGTSLGPLRLSAIDCGAGDPFFCLRLFQSRERGGIGRYDNPEFERLFAQQATEFDPQRREAILQQMMQIAHDDPIAVYLYPFFTIFGVSDRIGDFRTARNSYPLFAQMTKLAD